MLLHYLDSSKGLLIIIIDIILTDATETPIERSKKSKRSSILEKKKRYSLKSQIILDKERAEKLLAQPFLVAESMILSFLKSLSITFTSYQ